MVELGIRACLDRANTVGRPDKILRLIIFGSCPTACIGTMANEGVSTGSISMIFFFPSLYRRRRMLRRKRRPTCYLNIKMHERTGRIDGSNKLCLSHTDGWRIHPISSPRTTEIAPVYQRFTPYEESVAPYGAGMCHSRFC